MSYSIHTPTNEVEDNVDAVLAAQYNNLRSELHALMNGIAILPDATEISYTYDGDKITTITSTNPPVIITNTWSGDKITKVTATFSTLNRVVEITYTYSGDKIIKYTWSIS